MESPVEPDSSGTGHRLDDQPKVPPASDREVTVPGGTARLEPLAASGDERAIARVLERVSDAVVALDSEWRFTYVNAQAEQVMRVPFAELRGREVREVFPELVGSRFHVECRRALAESAPLQFEEYYAPRSTWLGVSVYPSVDGLSIYFQDITERKGVEQALRASERRHRSLVEASAQVVWSADARGEVQELPAWSALTGQTAEEVRGWGWLDAIHSADRERTRQAWERAVATGHRCETIYRVRTAEGDFRYFFHRSVPVTDESGVVQEWVGMCSDITERKRADEWRAFLADASRMLGSSLDVATTLTNVARLCVSSLADYCVVHLTNESGEIRAAESVHWEPARADLLRRMVAEYPIDTSNLEHPLAQVFRTGTSYLRHEISDEELRAVAIDEDHLRLMRAIGVDSGLNLAMVSRGRTLGALALRRSDPRRRFTEGDLAWGEELASRAAQALDNALLYEEAGTARRDAEESRGEAERLRQAAEGANLAKSEFLAVMSHELRTPLNAIGGYADLLEMGVRGPVNPEQQEDLRRIKHSGSHLLGLINEILSFARVESGRVPLDLKPLPIAEALRQAESLVMPQMRGKGLELVHQPCEASLRAHADGEKVQQVLVNLLTNAIKFTDSGGRIVLGARREGDQVIIRVQDTGRGVAADKLESIFEPYVQLASTREHGEQGVGLGLTISRDLARAMRGDLHAESVEGRGSTFILRLPVAVARRRGD
ncbi:MAG TPA: PAS domain-containing protein [Gemmatimonadaceae bacterium]|nr:PAS domain-containing protein [Gemmatimonadaceae bacterium]